MFSVDCTWLHVTLANWQLGFGFEFHLRSSPSAYSGFVNISRPAEYFTACYIVLKRPNKVETAVHGCNLAFRFGLYRVVAPLSFPHSISLASLFTSLSIFGWRDLSQILRIYRQHFRLRSFAILCSTKKCMAIRTLCRTGTAIHFFVNLDVFKRLYLSYVWVYLHKTWGFCKAWSALYDYVDQ